MARSDMVSRRTLMKRNACNDWTFHLSWSGSHGKCGKPCSEYFEMIGEKCIKDKSSNKGSLDVGCGTYNFKAEAASTKSVSSTSRKMSHRTATTTSTSSTSRKTSRKPSTTTTSASSTSKRMSHSPSSTSSSRTKDASKSISTPSKPSFLTSTPLATTESFPPSPTDSSYRPLIVGEAVCEDEANLPGHAPINEEHQGQLASIACNRLLLVHHISSMDSHSMPITYNANPDGTNYFYSISWIDGCETAVESQDPSLPLGSLPSGKDLSPHCSDILTWAYDWCKSLIACIS